MNDGNIQLAISRPILDAKPPEAKPAVATASAGGAGGVLGLGLDLFAKAAISGSEPKASGRPFRDRTISRR
jgi:hypothetical protein